MSGRGLVAALAALAPLAALSGQVVLPGDGARLDDPVVVGVLRPHGLVEDPVFGVAAPALGLAREVEMYQWHERREASRPPVYELRWSAEAIDSGAFAEPAGHENPGPLPFVSERWFANEARLDDRPVTTPELWRDLGGWQPLSPDPTALPPNLALLFASDGVGLSTSEDPEHPRPGDLRVRWLALPGGPVRAELVLDDGVWRPAGEQIRAERLPSLPEAVPGFQQGRPLASDLWLWLITAGLFGVLAAVVVFLRSRSARHR